MFTRSILIPSLLVCAVCAPILLSEPNIRPDDATPAPQALSPHSGQASAFPGHPLGNPSAPGQFVSYSHRQAAAQGVPSAPPPRGFRQDGLSRANPHHRALPVPTDRHLSHVPSPTQTANSFSVAGARPLPFGLASEQTQQERDVRPAHLAHQPIHVAKSPLPVAPANPFDWNSAFGMEAEPGNLRPPVPDVPPTSGFSAVRTVDPIVSPPVAAMVPITAPDFGRAETLIFPGNKHGPDLSAQPLEFLPVADFREIFRFDLTADWVKQRWKRVSTTPRDTGLRGLRVALVTGTNSWDLHGSLTYYFDSHQRLQRITFRGWTGDTAYLLQMLTSAYGFEAQPSLIAGYYLARQRRRVSGALLMKEPPVVRADIPDEKMALVLEINNPAGKLTLSEDIQLLIAGSIGESTP